MTETRIWFAGVAMAIIAGVLSGCGAPTPVRRFHPAEDGSGVFGAEDDAGNSGGAGPNTGGAGGIDTGGTGGQPDLGGAGGTGTGGGGNGGGSGGTSGEPADASAGGSGGAGVSGTGGSATGGASGGATGGSGATPDAGSAQPEAGHAVPGDGTTAYCFTDPNVVAICKQLEPACSNCPDTSILNDCYDVAAAGDDRACARYAVNHKCTVDVGGNTCGSLNCRAAGCNRSACTAAQGEGDTNMCQPLLATCPCK